MEARVLGTVDLADDHEPVALGGPRQRRLLAVLVANLNRAVAADTLIDIVFDGAPPDGAPTTLRSYVARLRRSLESVEAGGALVTEPPGYALRLGPDQVDAERFALVTERGRQQLAQGEAVDAAATLGAALAIWRGPAYDEFAHEEWARGEVARLEQLRAETEERLVDAQLACGMTTEVLPGLARSIEEHPYRERLRAQLMLALYRSGRQPEALRSFERYREQLIEVGLEPSAELVALERSIAVHDPALHVTARGTSLRGYRLGAVLGEGRHGPVHRAIQPGVGREVAVKEIRAELAAGADFIRGFDRQLQLTAQLAHPHIVPIHDFWREPTGAYVVMRLLPSNLERRLESGPGTASAAIALAEQLGGALDAAHRVGIAHGDLRPSNVLLDDDANAYLADIGIDTLLASTERSEPCGFDPPEALAGWRPTPAGDQYSLAIVLASFLTGVLPFGRRGKASPHDLLPSLHAHRPSLPVPIDEVMERATAWSPDDRYASVTDFVSAVVRALGGEVRPLDARFPPVNPFRGLRPFTEADAAHFVGREELVDDLVDRLGEGRSSRFVTVIGASGSGKSSIVRAGLLPRLRRGAVPGSDAWFIATMVPGTHPIAELESALRAVATTASDQAMTLPAERSVARLLAAAIPEGQPLLLVIDQLEELFTLAAVDEREEFVDGLTEALRFSPYELLVVATLRADFYDRPLRYAEFGRLVVDDAVAVVAMTASQLDRAIREPAASVGVEVEPTVVAEIVAEVVDQPSALPLLQFAMTELFERRTGSVITLDSYRQLGGLKMAVARRAEILYEQLSRPDRDRLRRIVTRLITVDDAGTATRRRATRSELRSLGDALEVDRVVDHFGSARLLAFDRDPATREPTVEVAHEALITSWPRFGEWVAEAGDGIRIRHQLVAAAAAWERSGRDEGEMYRGARLETASAWAEVDGDGLGEAEREFLRTSVEARNAAAAAAHEQHRREQRERRRLRRLVVGVAAALVLAIVAGVVAVDQRDRARAQATRADAEARTSAIRALAASAHDALGEDPALSLLLAIEAVRASDDDVPSVAEQALHDAVAADRLLATLPSRLATFSPDGSHAALTGADPSEVRVWSIDPLEPGPILTGHGEVVNDAVFSTDGMQIATASDDGTVRVWDVATGQSLSVLTGDGAPRFRVAVGPASDSVAATGPGDSRSWTRADGSAAMRPTALPCRGPASSGCATSASPTNAAWSLGLDFSHDGSLLAIAANADTESGVVALWDARTGELVRTLDGHRAVVTGVAFSPDDSVLYSSSLDGTVAVWDPETGERVTRVTADEAGVWGIDVSDDGQRLATAGASSVMIWDAVELRPELSLLGSAGVVSSIDLSADGERALTVGEADGLARLWDIGPGVPRELGAWPVPLADTGTSSGRHVQADAIGGIAFDPTSGSVVVGAGGTVASWSLSEHREPTTFPAPGDAVTSVATSADGSLVAASGTDGVRVYAADSGRVVLEPLSDDVAADVEFDPNGDRLVWAGRGAQLVSLTSGERDALVGNDLWVYDAEFSADGSLLALARSTDAVGPDEEDLSPTIVDLIDATTLEIHSSLSIAQKGSFAGRVLAVAFSPDTRLLATASEDGTAALWDTATSEIVTRLEGHTSGVRAVEFDPTRDELATGSADGTIRIWDPRTGVSRLTLRVGRPVEDIAYSPDGRSLTAIDALGSTAVFALDVGELLAEAQQRPTRSLTPAECTQFLPTLPCPAPTG